MAKTRNKMTVTSTVNTFNVFLPPPPVDKVHAPPQGQILDPPLETPNRQIIVAI